MIAANNGYVLAFDNLSGLPNWLSDALCRLATGGSFAVRQLYTDDEEVLFEAARPILLNGIEEVVSRPDLGDRAIFLTLAPDCRGEPALRGRTLARVRDRAAPHSRRPARRGGAWAARDRQCSPRCSCRAWQISRSGPRLAKPALWPAGTFARAYAANRRAAIESIIEADPIATCVRTIMADRTTWTGSASDLLRLCAESARDDISGSTPWAKNPRALAGRLRRAQTFLRTLGIEITFSREGRAGDQNDQGEHEMLKIPSAPSASSVPPAGMALTAISPVLLGSRNEQQRLQTMLTVLTQTQGLAHLACLPHSH